MPGTNAFSYIAFLANVQPDTASPAKSRVKPETTMSGWKRRQGDAGAHAPVAPQRGRRAMNSCAQCVFLVKDFCTSTWRGSSELQRTTARTGHAWLAYVCAIMCIHIYIYICASVLRCLCHLCINIQVTRNICFRRQMCRTSGTKHSCQALSIADFWTRLVRRF